MEWPDWRQRLVGPSVAIAWTAVVALVTSMLLMPLLGQWQARGYATVTGVVTQSEVQRQSGDRGGEFKARVVFEYEVDGRSWSNDTYGFSRTWSSNRRAAEAVVARYPVGTSVTVFHDPRDPAQAVLEAKPSGDELVWLLLVTPFVNATLLIWFIAGRHAIRPRRGGEVIAGASVVQSADQIMVRVPKVSLFAFAAVAAGIAGLAFAVVLIPISHAVAVSANVVLWAFLGVGVAATGGVASAWRLNFRAPRTIELDTRNRRMTARWFTQSMQTEFRHIRSIEAQPTHLSRWDKVPVYSSRVLLHYSDERTGQTHSLLLPAMLTDGWTEELADWLRAQVEAPNAHD